MNAPLWGQASIAESLLAQAKQEYGESGELLRLILAGTCRIDAWLIEQRIVPTLQQQGVRSLHFTRTSRGEEKRSAALIPLADGSAVACDTSERWSVLAPLDALSVIEHIGFRYAPENAWVRGFDASVQAGDQPPCPFQPFDVATTWQEITGTRPAGFETGALDQLEALSLQFVGRVFNTLGHLGL